MEYTDLFKIAGIIGGSIGLVFVALAAAISKSGSLKVQTPATNGKIDDLREEMHQEHLQLKRDLYNDIDRRFKEISDRFAEVGRDVRELRTAVYRRWPRRDGGDE